MVGLSVASVVRDEKFLFPEFQLFAAFEPIQKNVLLHINTREDTNCTRNSWLSGMYGDCSVPFI
jgi:hypothetical protein